LISLEEKKQELANNTGYAVPDLGSVIAQLDSAIAAGQGFTNQANSYANQVLMYNGIREKVLDGIYSTTLILTVAGVAGAIFGLGVLSLILGIVGWLLMFVNWTLFGIHYPLANLIADLCIAVRDLLNNNDALEINSVPSQVQATLSVIEDCSNNTELNAYRTTAQNGINFAFNLSCSIAKQLCNSTFADFNSLQADCNTIGNISVCGDVSPGNNCTVAGCDAVCNETNFEPFIDNILIPTAIYGCFDNVTANQYAPINDSSQCDARCPLIPGANFQSNITCLPNQTAAPCAVRYIHVQDCSVPDPSCPVNGTTSNYINNTLQALALFKQYVALFDEITANILNCSLIQNIFNQVGYDLCNSDNSFLSAIFLISVSTGIIAAGLLPATIIGIIGFKRFDRSNHKYVGHDPYEMEDVY